MESSEARVQTEPDGMIASVSSVVARRLMATCSTRFDLNSTSRSLYLWLCEFAGESECIVYPGPKLMSALLGISSITLWRAERELIEAKLIEFAEGTPNRLVKLHPLPNMTETQVMAYHDVVASMAKAPTPAKRVRKQQAPPSQPAAVVAGVTPPPVPEGTGEAPPANAGASEDAGKGDETKKPRTPLSDDQKRWICSSLANMERYLRFGKPAVENPEATDLKSAKSDWRQFAVYDGEKLRDTGVSQWNSQHFVGYFWYRVSLYNTQHGLPISMPTQWGRMTKIFHDMLSGLTRDQLYRRIVYVCHYFDVIKFKLGRIGESMALTEATLQNQLVLQTLQLIENMGEAERAALSAKAESARQSPILGIVR
jgi:hypothetical protein